MDVPLFEGPKSPQSKLPLVAKVWQGRFEPKFSAAAALHRDTPYRSVPRGHSHEWSAGPEWPDQLRFHGQQIGDLNAAGVGTVNVILLIVIGWAFAHKERVREMVAGWRRRRAAKRQSET